MTPHEVDISWSVLRDIARQWAGDAAELESVAPLAGGSMSTTLSLELKDARKAVLKITPHRVDQSYTDEAWQLGLLREIGLPVPDVYTCKLGTLESPFSYILMQFVEGLDLAGGKAACMPAQFEALQIELAEFVLKLHRKTSLHYMRIGSGEGKKFDDWPACYHEIYDPIWNEVEKSGAVPIKCRKIVNKIHERLDVFITHSDCPRLLHSDLWSTNVMVRPDESDRWHVAAFIDPHCKYGHVESELAYLDLFQTVTPTFMKTYQQERKLTPEYHQVRKPIYQLYSMLNHLRLFGVEYQKRALLAIERVSHLV